jgi:hypothetical protein
VKRGSRQIILGVVLLVLSVSFYILHYAIFRDPHHIFIYLVGDVAFVFVEVLLVTLIIHQLLEEREKRTRLEKLNMVIGAFFSEVGTWLLRELSELDPKKEQVKGKLTVEGEWDERAFGTRRDWLKRYDYEIEDGEVDWEALKRFLLGKRTFLLRLLENPNILEHESFTELLRAVFHLTEELGARDILVGLPSADHRHLVGDIKRVYKELGGQWLDYMNYLKDNYPYLFSLALRTNPFDEKASVVLREAG